MGDWDFSAFLVIPLFVIAVVLLLLLLFIKNEIVRKTLIGLVLILVSFSVFVLVSSKINFELREERRNSAGN